MQWIKANDRTPKKISKVIFRQISTKCILSESMARDWIEDEDLENLEWLDESDLPNEPSINIRSISEKWVGIWQRGENPNLFQCVDEAIKEALKPQPIQEDCHCTPDQTTGHTAGKCNVCGKNIIAEQSRS